MIDIFTILLDYHAKILYLSNNCPESIEINNPK
jgi:hypothetical protein